MNGRGALWISAVVICTRSAASPLPQEGFAAFASRVAAIADSAARERAVDSLLSRVRATGAAMHDDSTVTFLYRGEGRRVSVAGDFDGWDPGAGAMRRVAGTSLLALTVPMDPAARCEYKLVVDSAWILDPLNTGKVRGGFGDNSELRMGRYAFPAETVEEEGVPRGGMDTIDFASDVLRRRIRVYVYTPAGDRGTGLPLLFVTDGGEFLELARARVVLDNLIAHGAIHPVIAVFIDPRSESPAGNTRMTDYALNDRFVAAVAQELRPLVRARYRTRGDPASTAIMGASMGGLIATYAALTRSDVFGLCGALSPSFQWARDSIIAMARSLPRRPVRFYMATGTIHDAGERSRIVRDILRQKGYDVTYDEVPESHNWRNWSGRLRRLLTTFWGNR